MLRTKAIILGILKEEQSALCCSATSCATKWKKEHILGCYALLCFLSRSSEMITFRSRFPNLYCIAYFSLLRQLCENDNAPNEILVFEGNI